MIYTYIYRTVYNLFSFLFGKQMEIKIPNPSSRLLLLSFLLFKHKAIYTILRRYRREILSTHSLASFFVFFVVADFVRSSGRYIELRSTVARVPWEMKPLQLCFIFLNLKDAQGFLFVLEEYEPTPIPRFREPFLLKHRLHIRVLGCVSSLILTRNVDEMLARIDTEMKGDEVELDDW